MDEAGDAHEVRGYRPGSTSLVPLSSVIIVDVTSPLSGIAVEKRRQLAATLGLLAMLFLAVGAVSATAKVTAVTTACIVVSLVVAVLLSLIAWGMLRSVRADAADRRIDAAIEEAMKAGGRSMCDCGHEHDPDELHFVDGEGQHVTGSSHTCAHDGSGTDCAHSCDTCVLASLRLDPVAAFDRPTARPAPAGAAAPVGAAAPAGRRRPQPGPGRG